MKSAIESPSWVGMLGELAAAMGASGGADALYPLLYRKALEGEPDCGGVLLYNYLAGEPITGVEKGHPLLLRSADSRFTLANFCRASLYATLATLKVGMLGSTETTFYTIAVYFGAAGITRTRHTIPAALTADLVGFIGSALSVRIFFGR